MVVCCWAWQLFFLASQARRAISIPVDTADQTLIDPNDKSSFLNTSNLDQGSIKVFPIPRTTLFMDDFVTYEPLPSAVVRGTISQAVASLQNRDSMEEVGHQIWVSGAVTFTLSPYYGRRPPLDVHEALLLISTFKAILTRFGYYASDFDINRKGTGSVGWGTLTRRLSSNLSDSTIGNISSPSQVTNNPPRYFAIPGTELALGHYQNFGPLRSPVNTIRLLYKAQSTLHRRIRRIGGDQRMDSEEWQSGPEKLDLGPLYTRNPSSITLQEGLMVLLAMLDIQKDNPRSGCLYDVYRAGLVVGAIRLWEGSYGAELNGERRSLDGVELGDQIPQSGTVLI